MVQSFGLRLKIGVALKALLWRAGFWRHIRLHNFFVHQFWGSFRIILDAENCSLFQLAARLFHIFYLALELALKIHLLRPLQNLSQIFKRDYLRMVIPALFLFNAGFTFFTTFWGIVLVEQFGFKQGQVGNFFAYLGIMIILAQGGFVRRLSGKVRDYKVLDISMFLIEF